LKTRLKSFTMDLVRLSSKSSYTFCVYRVPFNCGKLCLSVLTCVDLCLLKGKQPSSSLPVPSTASAVASHRYNSKDQPPFVVQVQSTKDSSHPLHISRVVSQIFPREILEIKKIGRSKVLVQTNTMKRRTG